MHGFAAGKLVVGLAAVPVVVIAVVLAGMSMRGSRSGGAVTPAGNPSQWYTVQPMSFELTIVAQGELEAKNQVELKCEVSGNPTITEVVEEGKTVKKGEVLVKLDPNDILQKLEESQLKVEEARASTIAAEQELAIALDEAESTRKAAEVELNLAELELKQWENGEVVQSRNELKLALEKATRGIERANRDHELSQKLYEQEFISFNELDDAYIEKIEAEDALATAKLDIEVFEKYEYLKDKQTYESAVEQAKAELARTISKNESELEQMRSKLSSERRQLAIYEARLKDLETQVAATTITAPQDGLVVYASSVGNRRWRGDPVSVGRQVRTNETIILLPDIYSMVATLKVHEALINQVAIGQPTTVVIDAIRDTPLHGTVLSKAVTPDDGGWLNPNLREYKVRVELPTNLDVELKPAMRCNGQIIIGRVENALAVPVQAVFSEAGNKFCYLPASGGRVRPQLVQVGRANEAYVEILSGLEKDDRVLLSRPDPGQTTGELKVATPEDGADSPTPGTTPDGVPDATAAATAVKS